MGINWDLRCEKGKKEEEKESNLTQGMEEASRVATLLGIIRRRRQAGTEHQQGMGGHWGGGGGELWSK